MQIRIQDLRVEQIEYQALKPIQGTLKTLSDKNYHRLKKSFAQKGMFLPMFVWESGGEYRILDGHGRDRFFSNEKPIFIDPYGHETTKVPCLVIQAADLKDAKEKLLIISSQYQTMTQEGFDAFAFDLDDEWLAETVHFDALPLADLEVAPAEGLTDDDAVPETPEAPQTRLGDRYQLGAHRLLCGDSTCIDDVEKLMDGDQADLVVTDPPYNVAYEGKTKDALTIANDRLADGDFYQFLLAAYTAMFAVTKDGAGIYIFHADTEGLNFRKAMMAAGFKLAQCCVWVKQTMVLGRQDYHWQHEPILYGWKPTAGHHWYADRKQTTVWPFDRPARSEAHPTMKPVDLIAYPIQNSSQAGDIVFDPFGGSGSTLIACEKTGRKARLMEIDPKYCDVIVKRWEEFTGKKAERIGGSSHDTE